MELYLVPPARLNEVLDGVRPYLESYANRSGGRYLFEDVIEQINNERFQLWVARHDGEVKASAMTQFRQFPRLRDLQIFMCAGVEREQWFHFIQRIENYAREMGAKKVTSLNRLGWKKEMQQIGYKTTHLYMEKEL